MSAFHSQRTFIFVNPYDSLFSGHSDTDLRFPWLCMTMLHEIA
nr:MAG TPA: hypothetical protein [Caudoviricetes sp.]